MKRTIVWFKRDLRTIDHAPLADALAEGHVAPLYVAEPDLWRQADRSARQWREHASALAKLKASLAEAGLPLSVMVGDATECLAVAARIAGATDVRAHQETGTRWTHDRDKSVARMLREKGVCLTQSPQEGVSRGSAKAIPDHLSAAPLERVDPVKAIAINDGHIPEEAHLGLAPDLCGSQPAESPAIEEFGRYCAGIAEREYGRDMWHATKGATASSRISNALSTGELCSGRALALIEAESNQARERRDAAAAKALAQLRARIGWRRSFIQSFERHPHIEPAERAVPESDVVRFQAWISGRTGVPLVDAVMLSLKATGWANFRMRHTAISFANHHLALDWSVTGRAMARLFTDYEPGIHWCQLSMMAGTPGHPRPNVYDPVKQGLENDPDETFVRQWIPELARIPKGFGHEPWRFDPQMHPIVDIRETRMRAIERMTGIARRQGGGADTLALPL